jgi:hypothetical protein
VDILLEKSHPNKDSQKIGHFFSAKKPPKNKNEKRSFHLHEKEDSEWLHQGCQMVCFQTKNINLGKFWWVLQWKILVHFKTIWSILRPL